jgi:hypothetical protein
MNWPSFRVSGYMDLGWLWRRPRRQRRCANSVMFVIDEVVEEDRPQDSDELESITLPDATTQAHVPAAHDASDRVTTTIFGTPSAG